MALRVSAIVKFFTPVYAATSTVKKSGSFVCEKPSCLTLNRGQLMPIGMARSYMRKQDPEDDAGAKPVLEVDELVKTSGMKKSRAENTEGKSMEKQEELKKRPDPKPEATDS